MAAFFFAMLRFRLGRVSGWLRNPALGCLRSLFLSFRDRPAFVVWSAPPGLLDMLTMPGRRHIPAQWLHGRPPTWLTRRRLLNYTPPQSGDLRCLFLVPDRLGLYLRFSHIVLLIVVIGELYAEFSEIHVVPIGTYLWGKSFVSLFEIFEIFSAYGVAIFWKLLFLLSIAILLPHVAYVCLRVSVLGASVAALSLQDWPWTAKAIHRQYDSALGFLFGLLHHIWFPSDADPTQWAPSDSRQLLIARRALLELFLRPESLKMRVMLLVKLSLLWGAPVWINLFALLLAALPAFGISENGRIVLCLAWMAGSLLFVVREIGFAKDELDVSDLQRSMLPGPLCIDEYEVDYVQEMLEDESRILSLMYTLGTLLIFSVSGLYLALLSIAG